MDVSAADWLTPLQSRGLIPNGSLAAFVVGSAARGWHNDRSDFDICVVSETEWKSDMASMIPMPLNPPRIHTETFYDQDRRWEITYWLASQIDQMLAKVSRDEYNRDVVAGEVLTPREELTLSRVQNCLTIFGEEWVAATRERLADSAFRSFVVARSLSGADDSVEDALGQLESGDLESATLSARRALGYAIDALLEGQGEYGSQSPKWRPNRFRAAAPDFLTFDQYWALETMRDYDIANPGAWIKDVLTVCQEISMRVETS